MEQKVKRPIARINMKAGGSMVLELYPDLAPITVDNFIDLAQTGFYNGLTFHRVVKDFMIQGGSSSNSCAGGNEGFTIKGEFAINGVDTGIAHERGVISMARAQHPDSAGTQFFVMHKDAPFLDRQYAAFGKMTEGFEVLDRIAEVPTAPQHAENRPHEPQVIESITIELNGYEAQAPRRIQQ